MRIEVGAATDIGRVRDRDLQRVINGLWESGAEAISINGQRLTALSAIRAAGDAILVDNRPLVPPYTVLAVGDGERLSRRFQNSADGVYLHRDTVEAARTKLAEKKGQTIDVGQFKDLFGISRKVAIPLLEFFDQDGATKRIGDSRLVL